MVLHVVVAMCYGIDTVAPPGNQAANREHKRIPKGLEQDGGKARRANPRRGTGGRKVDTGG
jgi:hypothetical protein